ncbi:hypothetical protein ABFX02_14G201700 [Erythranthe guttata]
MAIVQSFNMMSIALLIGLSLLLVAKSDPNTSVNLIVCNGNSYSQSDAYANSVAYVLADMMNVTPNHGYDYKTQSPYAQAVSYGHATCNTALNYNDCADCMIAARSAVTNNCLDKVGAQVSMVDCSMRYENYSF